MGELILIRHGQASLLQGDYDQLTALGEQQSQLLGIHFASRSLLFDHVYIGPRRRHRETHDLLAAVYGRQELPWPGPVLLPELDEFQGEQLLKHCLPDMMDREPCVASLVQAFQLGGADAARSFEKLFQIVTSRWVRGELRAEGIESWPSFRARVAVAIETMRSGTGQGKRILAFTSGGPVAAATGLALDLSDEKTLHLSWVLQNTAFTEFLFSAQRFSLRRFNLLPHLSDPALVTDH